MRWLRSTLAVSLFFVPGAVLADAASQNREIVLDHLQSVIAANFSQTEFLKHVEKLGDQVLVGVLSNDGKLVQYTDDKKAVEGLYDVITSNKKNLFAARCRNTATDKARVDDLIMCDLFVENQEGVDVRVEMFYGLKEGNIARIVMGQVKRSASKVPLPPIKPVEKN